MWEFIANVALRIAMLPPKLFAALRASVVTRQTLPTCPTLKPCPTSEARFPAMMQPCNTRSAFQTDAPATTSHAPVANRNPSITTEMGAEALPIAPKTDRAAVLR